MDHGNLGGKTIKELRELCKEDRITYRGYSKCTKKEDLIEFTNLIEKQLKLSGVNFSFNLE